MEGAKKRMMRWTSMLFVAAWIAAPVAAPAQVDPNRVVLSVNGEEIKAAEYYKRMEFLPGVGRVSTASRFEEQVPGILTLQRLINERLLLQLAKQKGALPSEADVAAELARRKKDAPQFFEALAKLGFNDAEISKQVLVDLAEDRLTTFGITITDLEVEKFYKENPTLFVDPKRYKLSVVAVKDEAGKAAVDADLKAGKPFAEVAKARSLEASKAIGGSLGEVEEGMLGAAALKAVTAVKVGQTTDWIAGEGSSSKLLVEGIVPEKKLALDAAMKERVRNRLKRDRGRVKNNVEKELADMRSKSTVVVGVPAFSDAIKQFLSAKKSG